MVYNEYETIKQLGVEFVKLHKKNPWEIGHFGDLYGNIIYFVSIISS